MNEIDKLLAEDTPIAVTNQQMGMLGQAVNRLLDKQADIVNAAAALKVLVDEEKKINNKEIPEIMEQLGFESITLKTGQKVAVKDSLQCSIPAPMRPQAFEWLDDHNHGDLIKANLVAKFPRGTQAEQTAALKALEAIGVVAEITESVHAGTLKAWARVETADGKSLPADLFKVIVIKQTTVK